MQKKINIMLVEDNSAYRRVITWALKDEDWIAGITQYAAAETALRELGSKNPANPDVIILDISLPGMTGLEALPFFIKSAPNARVVMLTQSETEEDLKSAVCGGAVGYMLKSSTARQIKEALISASEGGIPLDSRVSGFLVSSYIDRQNGETIERNLSTKETAVLQLLAAGRLRKEIADELDVSITTVVTHINRIFEKLEVNNAPSAVSKGYRCGILPL